MDTEMPLMQFFGNLPIAMVQQLAMAAVQFRGNLSMNKCELKVTTDGINEQPAAVLQGDAERLMQMCDVAGSMLVRSAQQHAEQVANSRLVQPAVAANGNLKLVTP